MMECQKVLFQVDLLTMFFPQKKCMKNLKIIFLFFVITCVSSKVHFAEDSTSVQLPEEVQEFNENLFSFTRLCFTRQRKHSSNYILEIYLQISTHRLRRQ